MKVLVTGAAGFVGRYVVRELRKQDHEVIAVVRDANTEQGSFDSEVHYVEWDLSAARTDSFEFFRQPDRLIHLAWEGLANFQDMLHIEKVLFTHYRFLKNIVESGLKEVTVVGTCLEYGMQDGLLRESMSSNPNTPYALAKDTLRKFMQLLQKKTSFGLKWLRLFYIYGKGQSPRSILSQLEAALGRGDTCFNMSGGEQLRDYLPVAAAAEYIVAIATQDDVQGIINCCSGHPLSVKKLVEDYLSVTKRTIGLNLGFYPYLPYEPMAFWGDVEKLNRALRRGL